MVEYNTVNAKLLDSQLNKLKSTVKNKQGTTLTHSARKYFEKLPIKNKPKNPTLYGYTSKTRAKNSLTF